MQPSESTANQILVWVKKNFPLSQKQGIGMDDSLFATGIVDSLGTLDVVQYLESEFGIEISDEEMVADHFETVHTIAQFVERKVQLDSRPSNSIGD